MRRLLPQVVELDLDDAYADLRLPAPAPDAARSTVAVGMVASVDGAIAIDGRSAGLGGPADRVAFKRLRDACDAIMVGAGTVRAEDYGPPRAPAHRLARRRAAGLADGPQLLVVTASADLSPTSRLFTAQRDTGVPPPIVVTRAGAPADAVARLRQVAEVVQLGDAAVDLPAVLAWTLERGWPRVLCEGGPRLNGDLFTAGVADELFVTLAPTVVAGDAGRLASSASASAPTHLDLVEMHEHGGELLLRYRVERPSQPGRDD